MATVTRRPTWRRHGPTCFVCGKAAYFTDRSSREPVCFSHWGDVERFRFNEQGINRARINLERCLNWQYGPDRTAAILAGEDSATESDLAAWRSLGT